MAFFRVRERLSYLGTVLSKTHMKYCNTLNNYANKINGKSSCTTTENNYVRGTLVSHAHAIVC